MSQEAEIKAINAINKAIKELPDSGKKRVLDFFTTRVNETTETTEKVGKEFVESLENAAH